VNLTKCYSGDKIKNNERGGTCSIHGDRIGADRVLVEIPKIKRGLGSPRRKWEDNINVDLQDVGWEGKNWIELAQDKDRRQALVECVNELPSSINCGEFLDWLKNY
jgi:hypothetical protein